MQTDLIEELKGALLDMRCAFAGNTDDPIVHDWWEARIPDYEDAPDSARLRQMALERAEAVLARVAA